MPLRIAFEPTGPCHLRLERQRGEAGLPLAKVNPLQARRFARATGAHATTDAIDAAMLARMVRPIVSRVIDEMEESHIARLALVKDRTVARNREHACRASLLKRHAAQRLAQIDARSRPSTLP